MIIKLCWKSSKSTVHDKTVSVYVVLPSLLLFIRPASILEVKGRKHRVITPQWHTGGRRWVWCLLPHRASTLTQEVDFMMVNGHKESETVSVLPLISDLTVRGGDPVLLHLLLLLWHVHTGVYTLMSHSWAH